MGTGSVEIPMDKPRSICHPNLGLSLTHHQKNQLQIYPGWWLSHPSEKYESQLGRIIPIYYGTINFMFQTTNQYRYSIDLWCYTPKNKSAPKLSVFSWFIIIAPGTTAPVWGILQPVGKSPVSFKVSRSTTTLATWDLGTDFVYKDCRKDRLCPGWGWCFHHHFWVSNFSISWGLQFVRCLSKDKSVVCVYIYVDSRNNQKN